MRNALRLISGLSLLILAGCSYDGSRFQYQSGGLPFLGMTLAVDHNRSSDVEIRRADSSRARYGEDSKSVLDRLPSILRGLRGSESVLLPEGTERVLEGDYHAELNEF